MGNFHRDVTVDLHTSTATVFDLNGTWLVRSSPVAVTAGALRTAGGERHRGRAPALERPSLGRSQKRR